MALRPFFKCECGDHAFVALTRGYVALVDAADVPLVSRWSYSASIDRKRLVYARRYGSVTMHRDLLGWDGGAHIDHINGIGTDNRRRNLRLCGASQNAANASSRGGTSRFKGVSKRSCGGWQARIRVNGRQIHLGSYANEFDAAKAYDAAALKHFSEFARLNLPEAT